MTLKKNQIDEIAAKIKSTDADQAIIEELSIPLYRQRIARYAKLMREVYHIFCSAGFSDNEAMMLTNTVLQVFLTPSGQQIPITGKKEEVDYAR